MLLCERIGDQSVSKCSVHENGYDGFICAACKADPVNAGWNDGRKDDGERSTPLGEERIPKFTRLYTEIVKSMELSNRSVRGTAAYVDCSPTHVQNVITKYRGIKKTLENQGDSPKVYHSAGKYVDAGDKPLIAAAWFEFKINAGYQGGTGQYANYRRNRTDEDATAPKWFIEDELGFRLDSGPSLAWTCRSLTKTNRAALTRLQDEAPLDLPKRVTYPKNFRHDPRPRRR